MSATSESHEALADSVVVAVDVVSDAEVEEYTYNPDLELEEAQQEEHQAYEGQQFYGAIKFGEFGKYMQNKRRKLGVQQQSRRQNADVEQTSETLKGLRIYVRRSDISDEGPRLRLSRRSMARPTLQLTSLVT